MSSKTPSRFLKRNKNNAFRLQALSSALREWADELLKTGPSPAVEVNQPGFGWYGMWFFPEPQKVDGKAFRAVIVGKDNQGLTAQTFSSQDEAEEMWAEVEAAVTAYKSKAAKSKTADSLMEEQVVQGDWVEVDGPDGTEWVEAGLVDLAEVKELESKLEDIGSEVSIWQTDLGQFTENRTATEITVRKGWWGARLSAPGYMDRTEWAVFKTEAEARAYLEEYYGEDGAEEEASLSKNAQEEEEEDIEDGIEEEDSTEAELLKDLQSSIGILEDLIIVHQSFVEDIKHGEFDEEELANIADALYTFFSKPVRLDGDTAGRLDGVLSEASRKAQRKG